MNREIKFRAWCPPVTDGEVTLPGRMNYDLLHQTLRAVRTETRQVPEHLGFEHVTSGIYELNEQLASYGDRLMQYTGLHDKNGKEIYEGDVVKTPPQQVAAVIYSDGFTGFILNLPLAPEYLPLWKWGNLEVIGNIYENPELLKP